MEAQGCGTPVVSTDVGGAREVVGAGSVVPPKDPAALARAVTELAERNGRALREQARAYAVEQFSYQQMGEAYESLYASHLSARAPETRVKPE
jgi:glycosyltransferase involved in cell wall biosynthesis